MKHLPIQSQPSTMLSVHDLLYLLTLAEYSPLNLRPVIDNHTHAVASITRAQISEFVELLADRVRHRGVAPTVTEQEHLNTLPFKLTLWVDTCKARVTVH